jgi:hypothetical protein
MGSPKRASLGEISHYLEEIEFPASKKQVIKHVESRMPGIMCSLPWRSYPRGSMKTALRS